MADVEPIFTTNLSAAQVERISLLAEECAEVIQAVGKILRHGFESRDPTKLGLPAVPTNRELLELELGHVLAARHMLVAAGDVDNLVMVDSTVEKLGKVRRWLHYQRDSVLQTATRDALQRRAAAER